MDDQKLEKLILEIMKEAEADGEPVTREEAKEMAEMELKAKKDCRRYEQSTTSKSSTTSRTVKKDSEKIEIIKKLFDFLLTNGEESATIVNEQREIQFRDFSITLTKHRKGK